jgi:hypothetical protein
MTPREELVCKLRSEGMVYRLIGKELGVTGQRARDIYEKVQRKKRGLERLKERELKITTQSMWEMLSELLDGEKLPDSLNKDLDDLREGKAFVMRELTDEEIHELANQYLRTQDHDGAKVVVGLIDFARELLKKASEK